MSAVAIGIEPAPAASAAQPLLAVRNVAVRFGGIVALDGVSPGDTCGHHHRLARNQQPIRGSPGPAAVRVEMFVRPASGNLRTKNLLSE
jgi:hypothetical protein